MASQAAASQSEGLSARDKEDIAEALVKAARAAGADAADAVVYDGLSHGVSFRLGKLEDIERSEGSDLGLRVIVGNRQAAVSSSDLSRDGLAPLAERAVAMARLAPEDPYCGLAPEDRLATSLPELDLIDPDEPSSERLLERARNAEESALAVEGVTNSLGASAGWGKSGLVLATSGGFVGHYAATSQSLSCSTLAGTGDGMERDYEFTAARHGEDLEAPEEIGRRAGERSVRRLSPRKAKSQSVSVVYDPRVSAGLVGHLIGAISGASVARGSSFLKDRMGEAIFKPGITVVDDPHRRRGLGSKPFDGEGVANMRWDLISDGVLTTWLLNTSSARQLGLETTGHASRGIGSPPGTSVTNLYMEAGDLSPEELIADIAQGFYVCELIGSGVNGVTGDYSRGASGYWIENGEITYPVSEITIAGNLKSMFAELTPASDLEFKRSSNAPTLRVDGMTLAGT